MTMTATAPHAIQPSTPVSESSSRCSGDFACLTDESIDAIWPIWVVMPVSVITTVAVPRVTWVFWNTDVRPVAERRVGVGDASRHPSGSARSRR